MNAKELKIEVPEGYKVDWDNSSMNTIRFKPIKKELTYEDIERKLLPNPKEEYIEYGRNVCSSRKQVDQLSALNKLMNVAKYLNGDWKPDFKNINQQKCYISYDQNMNDLSIWFKQHMNDGNVYFKSEELARQALEILGEEEVKKALGIFE